MVTVTLDGMVELQVTLYGLPATVHVALAVIVPHIVVPVDGVAVAVGV